MRRWVFQSAVVMLVLSVSMTVLQALAILGGPIPGPLPLFPRDNWWNRDISDRTLWPVDPNSATYINFIGATKQLHPDFGGEAGPDEIYGFPYIVVDDQVPKVAVEFNYWDESDGVNLPDNDPYPFYPIPIDAATTHRWVEGGPPGNVDIRDDSDRHILIVDSVNKHLYELYNVWYDTANAQWHAGSGAFFDMNTNNRRPEGWTSADAAGLAILPGLVRHDEVYGTQNEIEHAFRVTVRATNGHRYPASHTAGNTTNALPMGARLRLKPEKDISRFTPEMQKIFRAMKKYGLIVADNGTDMYISGTNDADWNNDVLNPAFRGLTANDFEVVLLGHNPPATMMKPRNFRLLSPPY